VSAHDPGVPIHHTLKAWQHAQRLAVECAKAANRFPDVEQTALADQLRRACYSVPLNIATLFGAPEDQPGGGST